MKSSQSCPPYTTTILPPTGLMAEADCIINVAQAERNVCKAEEKLAHYHVKEAKLRTRLYQIQSAMATRLVQISTSKVGQAHAHRE